MSPAIYFTTYPGYLLMQCHDDETNDLKRWFDNYKVDKYATFTCEHEWLVIDEQEFFDVRGKRRRRFVGVIGADHTETCRKVDFDTSAPPPPTFWRPSKVSYTKESWRVRQEQLQRAEQQYLLDVYSGYRSWQAPYHYGRNYFGGVTTNALAPAPKPPPPQYRRN